MTSIMDVSNYILHQHGPMSPMKLQKLCYYAQAWSLVWNSQEMFSEEFEAWKTGPVCRELFLQTQERFRITANVFPGQADSLSADQKDTIDRVIEYYGKHDAQWLGRLAQMEDPWKEATDHIRNPSPSAAIVTKDSTAKYYACLTGTQ